MANKFTFNPFTGTLDVIPDVSTFGTGDVVGPASSTDNALVRFNGVTGKLTQNSTVILGDTGALVNNLTADVVAISLKGNVTQTNKVFRIERGSNTDEVLSIDNNGSIITMGDLTINNIRTNTQSIMEFAIGASDPAWFLHGTTTTADFLSLFKIEINKATNRGLIIKGRTGQTANLQEWRNDSDAVLLSITATGTIETPNLITDTSNIITKTGNVTLTGDSGRIRHETGSSVDGSSGPITHITGNSTGLSGDTGPIVNVTGDSTSGSSGDFFISIGTAAATRGQFRLTDGTEGTIGHVLTSTDTNGRANWAALNAANTSLSNLASTAVNDSIIPDNDNDIDLGDTGLNYFNVHTYNVNNSTEGQDLNLFTVNSLTNTGSIYKFTGNSTNNNSGSINYQTGDAPSGSSGGFDWIMGSATTNGNYRFSADDNQTFFLLDNVTLQTLQTDAPVITANVGVGDAPTVSLGAGSTDMAGSISITPGGSGIASGSQVTITFNKEYPIGTRVILTPSNANAAIAEATLGVYKTSDETAFDLNVGIALTTATTYTWDYIVIGY